MELTKEYFDKALKRMASKNDLAGLVSKNDLQTQTVELKKYVRDSVENLARIVAETIAIPMEQRFNRLEKLLDVTEDVHTLKLQVTEIYSALNISPKKSA